MWEGVGMALEGTGDGKNVREMPLGSMKNATA